MDKELFELCKAVYERLKWDDDSLRHKLGDDIYDRPLHQSDTDDEHPEDSYHPLYTSDYLFGVLPPVILDPDDKIFKHIQMWINGDGTANAGYVEPYAHDDKVAYAQKSSEMRKTLLKLALALHKAGELEKSKS